MFYINAPSAWTKIMHLLINSDNDTSLANDEAWKLSLSEIAIDIADERLC